MARRTSFIGALAKAHARSVREVAARQRATATEARQAEQARAAAARAMAAEIRAEDAMERSRAAAREREIKARETSLRQAERDRARSAREDEQALHAELAEQAERSTLEVLDTLELLKSLLSRTLQVDDRIEFSTLLVTDSEPTLTLPKLELPKYSAPAHLVEPVAPQSLNEWIAKAVPPQGFIERLFGLTGRRDRAIMEVSSQHEAALASYNSQREEVEQELARQKSEFAHKLVAMRKEHEAVLESLKKEHGLALIAFEQKRSQRASEVEALELGYREGEETSVELYNEMVLERSEYPAGFPQDFRLVYTLASRQLVVDYELPTFDIVPTISDFRYVKSRKIIDQKLAKPADIKAVYKDIVAQVALRTLHEVFEADQGNHIDSAVFSGYVNQIDVTTGHDIRPYLVSVRAIKTEFESINLARVEPQVCLRNLGAQISAQPSECRAVKPVIEFNMVDARFVEESYVLSSLDERPNLMDLTPSEFEALVSNLFNKMGLDTKLTRSSRDGGVDAVAFDTRPILGGKVVIQAKRYRHTVGVSAVRDLYGTMLNEGASKGIIVATSGYGPDAFSFANDKPLELIDGGGLLYLLESIGRPARIIMPIDDAIV